VEGRWIGLAIVGASLSVGADNAEEAADNAAW
jgi:hypothetical protein